MMPRVHPDQIHLLKQLRKEWVIFAVISAGFSTGGFVILWNGWHPQRAMLWLLSVSVILVYLMVVLWDGLADNRLVSGGDLLPTLGIGNFLTLSRGVLLAALAGFLLSPRPSGWIGWIPAGLYWAILLLDFLDGYSARVSGQVTSLGESLDMRFDGLGILVAAILAVRYGQVPAWYLVVGLARYLFIAGMVVLEKLGKTVYPLPEKPGRRAIAGVQMGFVGVMLLPLFTPPGTWIAATLFVAPFLANFAIDWLTVVGVPLPFQGEWNSGFRKEILRGLPILFRGLTATLLIFSILVRLGPNQFQPGQYPMAGINGSSLPIELFSILEIVLVILITLGISGRIAALGVLILLGFQQMVAVFSMNQIILLFSATAMFYLGTGEFSLWTPERSFIANKAGEPTV